MTTTLITGANRGLGLALARLSQERGDNVIAVCRRSSVELDGLGVRVERDVDVADDSSVNALAQRLAGLTIDRLINNAGIMSREPLEDLNFADLRQQLEVNALGPLRVTAALLPMLNEGSKIALITSRLGSMTDNSSGGLYGYRMSKAALNMAGVSLANDLLPKRISVVLLHPGSVATDMTNHGGTMSASASAVGVFSRIDELDLTSSGQFQHIDGSLLPW